MIVCPQCHGNGVTKNDNQPLNVPNSMTFTAQTRIPEVQCNVCLGNGYFSGSST